MLTNNIVDAISDDFQSTFMAVSSTVLSNCLYAHEKDKVETIIKKHVPSTKKVIFEPQVLVAPGYSIYKITLIGE